MKKTIALISLLMLPFPLFVGADPDSQSQLSMEDTLDLHSVLYPAVKSLKDLSERDYAPAQELLGFLTHNPKEIKPFLEKYDERKLKPHLPSTGHSRSFWQRFGDVWREDISYARKEADTFMYGSLFFLPAMSKLRLFFSKLDKIDPKYDWSKFIKNFVSEMLMGQSVYREYYLSSGVSARCEKTFRTYFR